MTTVSGTGPVDINTMLGAVPQGPGYRHPDELLHVMDTLRIARSVVVSSLAWRHDAHAGNLALSKAIDNTGRLRACWVLVPGTCQEMPCPEELIAMMRAADVAALRICPEDHGWDPSGPAGGDVMSVAAEYNAPLLVDLDQLGWVRIDALADTHPALPIVVTTVGYRTLREAAAVMRRRANVHVDLSYLGSHNGLEWIVRELGCDRVLFGTGAPLRDPVDATVRLRLSRLDGAAEEAVATGNFDRLMAGRRAR
ncbi:amidohydrolase family protein [Saccharopolyspora sp. NPDC002376]